MRHWIALGPLMAVFAAPAFAAEPETLPKELVEAWKKQKHHLGWMGLERNQGTLSHQFDQSLLEPDFLLPAFDLYFPIQQRVTLAGLPHPDRPFGIKLYANKGDGRLLRELKDFKHLTRLAMYECPMEEEELLAVADLSGLEELQLWGCKIGDQGLKTLAKLKNLKKLGLRGTQVTDAGIPTLAGFEKLEHLELGSNLSITDKGAADLPKLKSLKYLDIHLTRIEDEGMKSIAQMKGLRGIYIMNTRATAAGLKSLGALKDLERFQMDGYGVNAESIAAVLGMTKLRRLELSIAHPDKTAAGDELFQKLAALKNLEHLGVFGWQITDASLPTIRGFEKLEFLDLRYTKVKLTSAMELEKEMPKCRIFQP
jgi:hypothetical protein